MELLTTIVYLLRILFVIGDISCEGYCLTIMCNVNETLRNRLGRQGKSSDPPILFPHVI